MNITENLARISNAKDGIKRALRNKGISVNDSALLDEYPAVINDAELYGPYYKYFYDLRTNNGTNMKGMFYYYNAPELDLSNLDASNVTTMERMFAYCSSSVNIEDWDTSNVTNMNYMFWYFTGSIDISKLDTSKVTNASYMFNNANTSKIILTGLSFPKCTKLDNMFDSAEGTTLDLSSWDISNITSMYSTFSNAKHKRIDLTGWNTSKVTNMGYIFQSYNSPLEELIIPDWDMTNVTSSTTFMNPSYMTKLKLIDLSRSNDATIIKIASFLPKRTATTFGDVIVPYDTSQAAYDALVAKYWRPIGAAISPIPTNYSIVAELDEIIPGNNTKVYLGACEPWYSYIDLSNVEIVVTNSDMATITEDNEVVSTGKVGNIVLEVRVIDTQEVIGTKTIAVSEIDSYPGLVKFRAASKLTSSSDTIITVNGSAKKLSALTYNEYSKIYSYDAGAPITSIEFKVYSYINELVKLNTSNMTTMLNMLSYGDFITLDTSNWDVSNVTNMQGMLENSDLIEIDVSNWDTGNVANMSYLFDECYKLTEIKGISDWDTSNVTNMNSMFSSCKKLTSLDLSTFNTNKLTSAGNMFYNCSLLTELDISNFDFSINSVSSSSMLSGCTALHTLRLDNCNNATISKIIYYSGLPTDAIEGVTRTIYCKEDRAAGLKAPTNWVFSYVD